MNDEILDSFFRAPDMGQMWDMCNIWYERLKFSDPISDDDRIKEYQWVTQQFRKYMFSKESPIRQTCEDFGADSAAKYVENLLANAAEYGTDRKSIVYNFIRDEWLVNLHAVLSGMTIRINEEDDDYVG